MEACGNQVWSWKKKRGKRRREGVLFSTLRLRPSFFFCVVVTLPVWQCKSSVRRRKVPLFLPLRSEGKSDSRANANRLEPGNKDRHFNYRWTAVCLVFTYSNIWMRIFPAFSLLQGHQPRSKMIKMWHCRATLTIYHLTQSSKPGNYGVCKWKITKLG